ncbi:NLR family CARD domain-containing protein 3-like [Archocentrus centrarchus]|uniref:NLR family CARD domain-containing protein 3-like n=1 Tax=Archocentrus centrarchus TaxID=63155 RepID=UPI0011EA1805|nr:NLR family CARD domain-containing protein 3-like [Archocentrus centrarchus]
MGTQWSAHWCGKKEENSRDPEKVSTTEKSQEQSAPLLRQPNLQGEEKSQEHAAPLLGQPSLQGEEKSQEQSTPLLRQPNLQGEEKSQEHAAPLLGQPSLWGEETSCRHAEETSGKNDCSDNSSAQVNAFSPCLSASVTIEEEEASWVDSNRLELIRSITLVMPVADEMRQWGMIHPEMYNRIHAAQTSQDKMRELYKALTTTKVKSAFYRILQEIQPPTCEREDVIKEAIRKNKKYLRKNCKWQLEGTEKSRKDEKSLDKIYTELHIIKGESEHVNEQHEIWEIEDKVRNQTAEGTKINCNDIFKNERDDREVKTIRTVMTKGIAGIGKTVSVKKFILDWADGKANQDLDFIFMFPFRELNLVQDDHISLENLVKTFHPVLKNIAVVKAFADRKVLFIFDGLDESQLQLNFKMSQILTDATKESSVDTLVTNLIRENLLPSAFVWITSRPGAVQRIPRKFIYQWTEVRGFNDPQKIEYFRKRVEDEAVAERIIDHMTMSRSLYIMCHIPIFCWIAVQVFEYLLHKTGKTKDENVKIPTTLTGMYTHFFLIQMTIASDKYGNQEEPDAAEIFKSNEEFILKLGRMAFEQLEKGKIIFTAEDLEKYGIDIYKAGVCCGLCTAIFKEENVFCTKKLYCFVHLTVQEYFAALFVYHSFASKKIDSENLKDFLLKGSDEELKSILEMDPVDLPLNELIEIAIANSTQRTTGELDMFLRFLIGLSLQSAQELLQGLIQQKEEHTANIEEIRTSLLEIDLLDCSAERCLNLVHCLTELKDSSLHDSVRQYLNSFPESSLSPVQCSALADLILMSNTPLEEFNLKKYRPSTRGILRLLPAVRNCRKARISGLDLSVWEYKTISSALCMPHSVLTELHLVNNTFRTKFHRVHNTLEGSEILADGLKKSLCKLEALSLSGQGLSDTQAEDFASAIKSIISNLRELELSGNILEDSICSVLSVGLGCPKLEKLRLNRNPKPAEICQLLVAAFTSNTCYLRELELSYINFKDSEMKILSAGLMNINCRLKALSLSHNKLTEKSCEILASAVSSRASHLKELDLSYNDLQDSGVRALCNALRSPHCGLKALRLSFCKVTGDGGSSLALALDSDHCSLKDLDLSFNNLTDEAVKLLTEKQRDSHCSLENLNVDQNEECWVDLKLLRQYACDLTLDPNTAGVNMILTKENKMAEFVSEEQPYPDHPDRFETLQVLCEEGLTGRHYWEAECFGADVGVAYKSIDRRGDAPSEFSLGNNEKSWCWKNNGCFYHNNSCVNFADCKMWSSCIIGVYLDWPAGILSFFEVFRDTVTHLYTVHTTFTEPLHPGFGVEPSGSVYLRKIK